MGDPLAEYYNTSCESRSLCRFMGLDQYQCVQDVGRQGILIFRCDYLHAA